MIYESKPFKLGPGEEISITPIELFDEAKKQKEVTRGVLLKDGAPVDSYILKIYKVSKNGAKTFVGFTFTDSFGQFIIPLSPSKSNYMITVHSLQEETENLELIIK